MSQSRHRATVVRIRKAPSKDSWIIFRADVGIFSSLLHKLPETDALVFREALLPVIKQELQVRGISLLVRHGDLFLPIQYSEITAKHMDLRS